MAESSRRCYCSVPFCSNSKQRHPYLSFHDFPKDEKRKKIWVRVIRRDEGPNFKILRGSTYVCSMHFDAEDIYLTKSGRKRLKKDATPRRFAWNNWGKDVVVWKSAFDRDSARLGVVDQANVNPAPPAAVPVHHEDDHSDTCLPSPGQLDAAVQRVREREAKVKEFISVVESGSASKLHINRYCATDDEFRFYTRFPSEKVFWTFWESVAPSASRLVYWSNAQKKSETVDITEKPGPNRKLALVDELFLYCCRVAVGLKEQVIADIFGVSTTTVSRVIITWANYLCLVLGSLPIWMSREQVRATMPAKLAEYCPHLRVIVDCTEIRCESPSSLTVQSETFTNNKNHTTFKALIGIAPSGVITFVSKLFTGSISDQEMISQSGILKLLEQGDACMADKGFIINQMLQSDVDAHLIIPLFERDECFSEQNTEKTQSITRLRLLVDRAIRKIKENHIWDTAVPLTLAGSVNQLWTTCCLMSNFQHPFDAKDHISMKFIT